VDHHWRWRCASQLQVVPVATWPAGDAPAHDDFGQILDLDGTVLLGLPDLTVTDAPIQTFYWASVGAPAGESGDVSHSGINATDHRLVMLIFELLPSSLSGPSIMPVAPLKQN
jgi:hypothetical protein